MRYRKADEIVVDGNGLRAVVGLGVGGLVLACGLGVAGWQLHWWAAEQSAQKNAQINRETLGFQQARVDKINQDLSNLADLNSTIAETTDPNQRAAFQAQAKAATKDICAAYHQVNVSYRAAFDQDQINQLTVMCDSSVSQPQQ